MKKEKAFTIVELLAAITILGLLLMIAVPSVNNLSKKSKQKQIESDAEMFKALVKEKIDKDTSIEIKNSANFTLKSINKNSLSGEYDDYSFVEVSGCGYTGDIYSCSNYEVYLYPEEGSYGYENKEYKDSVTSKQKHTCNKNEEWCQNE